ncbi:MAG: lipopolysaccharide biosynthesis protein, partial [Cyclobacteriaceae bacterium]|nr:lipopolysaccharide biosynthesis protein [Cyclobacteriaceae bacterium]
MLSKVNQHVEDFRKGFLTKGSFAQNLAITFSGNVIAQVIGFAFTPFIARIYGPEAYGVFALFLAVTSNLSPVATLQFPSGYVAATDENEFYRIVKITFIVLVCTTFVYLLTILLYQNRLVSLFNVTELSPFIFWMPLYFFLMGFDYILLGWNIRLKEFKRGAAAKMVSTIASKGSTILFGIFSQPMAIGIIMGNLLSYPIESFVKLGPTIRGSIPKLFKPITWDELKATLTKFKSYALFVTPGLFITNLSSQLPVYYFSLTFNQTTVGLFALANSIVNIPLSLIANSSTTVFLQKAAETMQSSPTDIKNLVRSLHQKLFLLSFSSLTLLAFTSEWIFKVVFGSAWEQAGTFATFLCIGAIFNVSYSPLSVLFRLMHKENINFMI